MSLSNFGDYLRKREGSFKRHMIFEISEYRLIPMVSCRQLGSTILGYHDIPLSHHTCP